MNRFTRLIQLSIICQIFYSVYELVNTINKYIFICIKWELSSEVIKLTFFICKWHDDKHEKKNSIIHCISCFRLLPHLNYYDPIHMFPPTTIPLTIPWSNDVQQQFTMQNYRLNFISFLFWTFSHFLYASDLILIAKVYISSRFWTCIRIKTIIQDNVIKHLEKYLIIKPS